MKDNPVRNMSSPFWRSVAWCRERTRLFWQFVLLFLEFMELFFLDRWGPRRRWPCCSLFHKREYFSVRFWHGLALPWFRLTTPCIIRIDPQIYSLTRTTPIRRKAETRWGHRVRSWATNMGGWAFWIHKLSFSTRKKPIQSEAEKVWRYRSRLFSSMRSMSSQLQGQSNSWCYRRLKTKTQLCWMWFLWHLDSLSSERDFLTYKLCRK